MQGCFDNTHLNGIDKATLTYFRFQCDFIEPTIEFYQSLAMNLDQRKDGIRKSYLYFTYHLTDNNGGGLLFEKDHSLNRKVRLQQIYDNDPEHFLSRRYLVIYVHFLPRLMKRLSGKAVKVKVPMQEELGMKFAVIEDPNGLEIRLVEANNTFDNLTDAKKNQWYARLGYYVHPVRQEFESQFYEILFSVIPSKNVATKEGGSLAAAGMTNKGHTVSSHPFAFSNIANPESIGGMAATSATTSVPNAVTMTSNTTTFRQKNLGGAAAGSDSGREGFCIVDSEETITGLSQMYYSWLGNGPRDTFCTFCIVRELSLSGAAINKVSPKKNTVLNLDYRLKRAGITQENIAPPVPTATVAVETAAPENIIKPMPPQNQLENKKGTLELSVKGRLVEVVNEEKGSRGNSTDKSSKEKELKGDRAEKKEGYTEMPALHQDKLPIQEKEEEAENDTKEEEADEDEDIFLGVGFKVPSIDEAITRLMESFADKVAITIEKVPLISKLGCHTRFKDMSGYDVDLISEIKKGEVGKNGVEGVDEEGGEFRRDFKYMKGQIKYASDNVLKWSGSAENVIQGTEKQSSTSSMNIKNKSKSGSEQSNVPEETPEGNLGSQPIEVKKVVEKPNPSLARRRITGSLNLITRSNPDMAINRFNSNLAISPIAKTSKTTPKTQNPSKK